MDVSEVTANVMAFRRPSWVAQWRHGRAYRPGPALVRLSARARPRSRRSTMHGASAFGHLPASATQGSFEGTARF